ncbi:hyaluronan mediated motility receptor isoform X2 [Pseudophryne corroboree]|uniref:hyaluronan mediated motility receptor isoform X2 n=1 Tax=Pseudophryne corroboree TaxID=495146 RepID=UPI0030813B58
MSFPKAPLRRFNEHVGCAPCPGSYDIKTSDGLKGPVSFEKSQRFKAQKASRSDSQSTEDEPGSPVRLRKNSSGSTPNLRQKAEKDVEFIRELKKQKALENEIRALLKERTNQDKKLQSLEEEFMKTEAKLVTAVREKTSLTSSIASLDRQIADLNKANDLLKTKFSDDVSKRKIDNLCVELMETKNKVDAKDKEIICLQANFEEQIKTLQTSLATSKAALESLTERNKLLEESRQEAANHSDVLEKELDRANALIEELRGENKNLDQYLSKAQEQLQDLQLEMHAKAQEYGNRLRTMTSQISEQNLALEDMESRLLQTQSKLEEALQKITQLEEQLSAANEERSKVAVEKAETEKKLGAALEQMRDAIAQAEMYRQHLDHAEEILKQKDLEQVIQRDTFVQKEEELLAKTRELEEMYVAQLQEKEKLVTECQAREKRLNEDLETLKQQEVSNLLRLELQTVQEEMKKERRLLGEELEGALDELQTVQEEMKKEQHLLEEELEGALDELDRLQQAEEGADKIISHLEEENKRRAEELACLEETLKGKNAALERAKAKHRETMLQLKEEQSNTLLRLADYESFKLSTTTEIECLQCTNQSLLDKVAEAERATAAIQQQLDGETKALEQHVCELKESLAAKEGLEHQLLELQETSARTKEGLELQLAELQETSNKMKERLEQQLCELEESSAKTNEGLKRQLNDLQEHLTKNKNLLDQHLELLGSAEKEKEVLKQQLSELMETSGRIREGLERRLLKLQESSNKTVFELELQVLELQTESAKAKSMMEQQLQELRSTNKDMMEKEIHERTMASTKVREKLEQQLHELQQSSAETKERLETQLQELGESATRAEAELRQRLRQLENMTAQLSKLQEERMRKEREKDEAEKMEAQKWRGMFEELQNKVRPFQQQLDAFEAEKNALLNENGAAQDELNKLSEAYAKLLGHQNQKQKIKHVMKLKNENTQLKQEITKLRAQLAKEKHSDKPLQSRVSDAHGMKRFDPSKAFQHDVKENICPKVPLRDGNRNPC